MIQGNLIPDTSNSYVIGTTDKKWDNIVTQDMEVCGNLTVTGFSINNCVTYQTDKVTTTDNVDTLAQTIATTSDTVYLLEIKVVALRDDASEGAGYIYKQTYRNDAGTVFQVGGTIKQQFEDSGPWDLTVVINGTSIESSVKGQNGKTIMWSVCTEIHAMTI